MRYQVMQSGDSDAEAGPEWITYNLAYADLQWVKAHARIHRLNPDRFYIRSFSKSSHNAGAKKPAQ